MKKAIHYIAIAAFTSGVLTGCTKNFEEINTDTNQVTVNNYKPEYSLTRAQLEFAGNHDFSYETWRVNIIYCSLMMQQLANTSWYAGDKYMQNDGWAASYFDVAYKDQVKYIVDMMEITKSNPQYANQYQIARIMKVLLFHRITDLYGDIPYSEAGQGFYKRIFTPKYDAQKVIYADMLKELDEAGRALDVTKDKPGTGDLMYGGKADQILKWKRFANSLMLRLAMRMTKVDPTTAKAWAEKAAAAGVMTSNEDNAFMMHDLSDGRNNVNRNSNILGGEWNGTGWDKGAGGSTDLMLSKTLVDFLKSNNDPRMKYMSQVRLNKDVTAANQLGMPNGYDQNGGANDISKAPNWPGNIRNYSTIRGDVMLKLNGATFFQSYAEVELLLAEAAFRGWNVGGTAAGHYAKGIEASMKQMQQYDAAAIITDAEVSAYLAANPYDQTKALEQINTQYWAATFLNWYETFANWRRSGFPVLTPVNYPGNATGGQIPRRMLYPTSESSANGVNYAEAIARQGANTFLTRVWWDK